MGHFLRGAFVYNRLKAPFRYSQNGWFKRRSDKYDVTIIGAGVRGVF